MAITPDRRQPSNGEPRLLEQLGGAPLQKVTASPDGRTLAAVDNVDETYLWDTRTGGRLPGLDAFGVVAFSQNGRLLATVGFPAAAGFGTVGGHLD
ncbi:MAG TPA: hypothetical protein VGW74_14835, partial [Propionibacteriaceae bacterium]|nr:hypothetical protein [Propionibacteriaceae bacterium]